MPILKSLQDLLGRTSANIENTGEEIPSEFDIKKFNVPIQQYEWFEFFEPDLYHIIEKVQLYLLNFL